MEHGTYLEYLQRIKYARDHQRYVRVNRIFFYDIRGCKAHIHLAPAKTLGITVVAQLVVNGLKEMARAIARRQEITEVHAVSSLVSRHRRIIERFGFTVSQQRHQDGRGVAVISKKDFLQKYGQAH